MPSLEDQLHAMASRTLDQAQVEPAPVTNRHEPSAYGLYADSPGRRPGKRRWVLVAACLALGMVIGGALIARNRDASVTTDQPSTSTTTDPQLASLQERAEAIAGLPATRLTTVDTTALQARNLIGQSSSCPLDSEISLYQFEFDRAFVDSTYRGPLESFPPIGQAVLLAAPSGQSPTGCGDFAGVLPATESLTLYGVPSTRELATAPPPDLSGRDWRLQRVDLAEDAAAGASWPSGPPVLRLETDGTALLSDGCNEMRGTYAITEFTIQFGDDWASTLVGLRSNSGT